MGLVRRVQAAGAAGAGVGDPPYDPGSGLGRTTWEFLTTTTWPEDGKKRETGTLLVFGDSRGLKFLLNDRDAGLAAFVTVSAEEDLAKAIEAALESPATDWRGQRKPGAAKRS